MARLERRRCGASLEPRWKGAVYIAGQTMMAVPVTLQPIAPDGKRFILLVPSGQNAAPPIDVTVNWPSLLLGKK